MTSDTDSVPPKFVIVTLPRSGSYHLVALLDSAADIVCHGEVFKRDAVELGPIPRGKLGMKPEDTAVRDAKPMQFLTRLRNLNGRKIVGFKMFPEHATRLKALKEKVLFDPSWRKVFLTRNPIASYASLLRAKETGLWTARVGAPGAPSERRESRVTFTPASFDEHMRLCAWFEREIQETAAVDGNPCLTIDYESVVDRSALPGLLRFLGSTAAANTLESDREKQFTGRFSDGFVNWDALSSHARAHGQSAALDALL